MQLPCVTARLVLLAPSMTHDDPAYSDATTRAFSADGLHFSAFHLLSFYLIWLNTIMKFDDIHIICTTEWHKYNLTNDCIYGYNNDRAHNFITNKYMMYRTNGTYIDQLFNYGIVSHIMWNNMI